MLIVVAHAFDAYWSTPSGLKSDAATGAACRGSGAEAETMEWSKWVTGLVLGKPLTVFP